MNQWTILCHEAEGSAEPLVVSNRRFQQRSNRSPLLLQQREPRRDQQRQVRHSVKTRFGHQLYRNRRFGDKIQNKISSHCMSHIGVESQVDEFLQRQKLNALGAHDVTEIFSPPRFTEVRSIRIYFLDTQFDF